MLKPKSITISLAILSSLSFAKDNTVYFGPPFQPAELKPSQMDFGGIGLMQMPTGRMAEEGAFSFGYSHNTNYDFYSLSLQLMPWLETTIRYTQVDDVLYSDDKTFSGSTRYTDKSIDTKLKLLEESHWLPETSLGLRDLGGTGLFDGEFIAATKRLTTQYFGQLDFTLGLGWGYLGQRGNVSNPLCSTANRFCSRSQTTKDSGGSIDYERWFHGPSSLFGGIEYQTPHPPLRFKLEYDGNNYSNDLPAVRGSINMTPHSPWNIGALYALNDTAGLHLSFERGNTITLGFTLSTNFSNLKSNWRDEPIPPPHSDQPTRLQDVNWDKVSADLSRIAGYQNTQIYHDKNANNLTLVANQTKYRDRNIAHERAAAVLANQTPADIQSYEIVETNKQIPLTQTHIDSHAYREVANVNYIGANIKDASQNTTVKSDILDNKPLYDAKKNLYYGLSPHLSQSFGNPESPYLYNLGVNANASYWLTNSLQLSSSVFLNVADNYDQFSYTVPEDGTSNYRVRTLVRAYVHDNDAYLNNLQLTWFEKYAQNWYQQFYAGYLETMFAGIGSEILYRKTNSNWAIGADITVISQRDPSSWFATFDTPHGYSQDTKVLDKGTTGHLSIYYEPKWQSLDNTLLRLDIGKFLAADTGIRLDFSRQFNTGVIVGAYASKTNMSAEEFGEGSFTKGFYLSIPFDLMSVKPSNDRVNFSWQPITRDGGQKLIKKNNLYQITDSVSPWFQRPPREMD